MYCMLVDNTCIVCIRYLFLGDLTPYKPRPETSAAVARNLVTRSLGLKSQVPKEKRDAESRQLKDARGKNTCVRLCALHLVMYDCIQVSPASLCSSCLHYVQTDLDIL